MIPTTHPSMICFIQSVYLYNYQRHNCLLCHTRTYIHIKLHQQTWFGAQPWKSYGIQLMPLTPASELRDDPQWVEEMLPSFEESCSNDKGMYFLISLLFSEALYKLLSFIVAIIYISIHRLI